jgi:hypothetical protein
LFPGLAVDSVDLAVAVEVTGDADAQLCGAAAGDANELGAGFADAQEAGDFSVHGAAADDLGADDFELAVGGKLRFERQDHGARGAGGVDCRCDFTVTHAERKADCLIGIQLAEPGVGIATATGPVHHCAEIGGKRVGEHLPGSVVGDRGSQIVVIEMTDEDQATGAVVAVGNGGRSTSAVGSA